MEQETMVQEIIHALKLHSDHTERKFVQMDEKFEQRFEQLEIKFEKKFEQLNSKMDERFDQLDRKIDGVRSDLTSTQKTTTFILSKIAEHEEKLLQLSEQQK